MAHTPMSTCIGTRLSNPEFFLIKDFFVNITVPKKYQIMDKDFVAHLQSENSNIPYDFLGLRSAASSDDNLANTTGSHSVTCVKLPKVENIKINNFKWQK